MTNLLNMVELIADADNIDGTDMAKESPLMERYPEIFNRGRLISSEFEWTHGSQWLLASYEIEGCGARASIVWYFDVGTRMWYLNGERWDDNYAYTFPDFIRDHKCDILRLIPQDMIPETWHGGVPRVDIR